ncbi:hypothetical protein [Marinimicrobium agarilyticum]|uniref:hypothetical protein n=1 Tax=Marinimicrobium agarilyticum TaxID=306546 RepID=UPI000485479C|nr:hypothetical protein [Marinimicrobium agarilyticum]
MTGEKVQNSALTDDLDWYNAYLRHIRLVARAALDAAAEAARRGLKEQAMRNLVEDRRASACRGSVMYAVGACKSYYHRAASDLNRACNGLATGVTASVELNFGVFSAQAGVSGTDNMLACKQSVKVDKEAAFQFCESDGIMFSLYAGCP